MMSYIKQPHYTMTGLNLPAAGMDVLHTTVAYPRMYQLLYWVLLEAVVSNVTALITLMLLLFVRFYLRLI